MSRITRPPVADDLDYPTSDGRPMAETDWHRKLMTTLIETLTAFFAASPRVCVSGNLLVFYEPGNRRRRVAPDVFVVRGVPKHDRPNYLIWRERKAPEFVIELTSSTTRREDVAHKFALYRDVMRVKEYFLFDPFEDYLDPPMQGYRLRKGEYVPIKPVEGRMPSRVVGLHLERAGSNLRLWNPETGVWLPTAEENQARLEETLAENERLRREIEELRRQSRGS
jgi:Uma2 family endonuclease